MDETRAKLNYMTNRQFVLQHYPDAILDFQVRTIHTLRERTWYQIRSKPYGQVAEIISRGDYAEDAWRNAKKNIKRRLTTTQLMKQTGILYSPDMAQAKTNRL